MDRIATAGTFEGAWRLVGTSHQGVDHRKLGLPCQDAFKFGMTPRFVWAAVADGLGSEAFSDAGARMAVSVVESAFPHIGDGPLGTDQVRQIIQAARVQLENEARARDCDPRKFSTTLQVVIVDLQQRVFFYGSVGDGNCILSLEGDSHVVLGDDRPRPDIGVAHLLHDEFERYLFVQRGSLKGAAAFLVFSDGLDGLLVVHAKSSSSANPGPVQSLRTFLLQAEDETRGLHLLNTLVSAKGHAHLRDDKTLVALIALQPLPGPPAPLTPEVEAAALARRSPVPTGAHGGTDQLSPAPTERTPSTIPDDGRNAPLTPPRAVGTAGATDQGSQPVAVANEMRASPADGADREQTFVHMTGRLDELREAAPLIRQGVWLAWVQTGLLIILCALLFADMATSFISSLWGPDLKQNVERTTASGEKSERTSVSGAHVRAVQELLAQLGYYKGALDGQYGQSTEDAIKRFQDDYGMGGADWLTPGFVDRLRAAASAAPN